MINNNDIMKKLRVALHLRDSEIVAILKLAEFEASEAELSAIFRREDHPNFRQCGDQLLRRFLDGLIIKNRGPADPSKVRPTIRAKRVLPPMESVPPLESGPRSKRPIRVA